MTAEHAFVKRAAHVGGNDRKAAETRLGTRAPRSFFRKHLGEENTFPSVPANAGTHTTAGSINKAGWSTAFCYQQFPVGSRAFRDRVRGDETSVLWDC